MLELLGLLLDFVVDHAVHALGVLIYALATLRQQFGEVAVRFVQSVSIVLAEIAPVLIALGLGVLGGFIVVAVLIIRGLRWFQAPPFGQGGSATVA